jgi:serine/threonine protein kinase/beta-lactam-binding protein with PASTA domain
VPVPANRPRLARAAGFRAPDQALALSRPRLDAVDAKVSDALIGRVLDGRYRIEARVARGGMATVYRALDTRLDRIVALKIMHQLFAEDDEFVTRFIREAKSAARLSHPNVVAVFDQGDDDGHVFLAMEYVQGRTLRDLLRERRQLRPADALMILEPILSALAAAHAAGIVHRDVKPENVLLADDGRVKLADFGLARLTANLSVTSTTTMIGTVAYFSPEQVLRGVADARSDVYAAGIVLFEMLTGRPPYEGETPITVANRHAYEDVPAPSTLVGGIPPALDALVQRATARDPDQRPRDAGAFLADVMRVRRGLPSLEADDGPGTAPIPRATQTLVVELPATQSFPSQQPWQQVPGRPQPWQQGPAQPAAWQQEPAWQPPPSVPDPPLPVDDELDYRRPRRRRRGLIAFFIVLLLALGAATAGWWYAEGRWATTPSLQNLSAQDAATKAKAAHLNLKTGTPEFSETVPKDTVLTQLPLANHRLLRGQSVTIVMSQGPERYEVPAFDPNTQTTVADYQTALTKAHLAMLEPAPTVPDEAIPAGDVLSVDPAPGTPQKRGAVVTVTVSSGPAPITISDYTGQPAAQAIAGLKAAGFTVPTPTQDYSSTVPSGSVISQSPKSGTGMRNDQITLDVSKGPAPVKVPDVRGMKTKDAQNALEALGFKVTLVHAPFGNGVVYAQSPVGGTLKPPGSTITLDIL